MRSLLIGCSLALMLAACASRPPPATNTLAVASSCIPAGLGPAPRDLETLETLRAIPDGPTRYMRLYADWKARFARMLETEPVIAACR